MTLQLRIYAWRSAHGNVGDDANDWLWPKVFAEDFAEDAAEDVTDALLGIGSVLDGARSWLAKDGRRCIVFGAGARSAATLPVMADGDWDIRFVRGPRTAGALAAAGRQVKWISDPAILCPLHHQAPAGSRDPARIGFVPYYRTDPRFAERLCAATGMELISPTLSPEAFFDRISSCGRVLAEAMHGAIFADAFGVPWAPCRLSNILCEGETHHFKWADWAESLDLPLDFTRLFYPVKQPESRHLWFRPIAGAAIAAALPVAAAQLRSRMDDLPWRLSDRDLLRSRQEAMLAEVARLRAELQDAGAARTD